MTATPSPITQSPREPNIQLVPRSSIIIREDRQRKSFDPEAEVELQSSIETNGLLHAPVVREVDGQIVLVAGQTRIRRIDDIWALGGTVTYGGAPLQKGFLPVNNLGAITDIQAEEAELDENLKRKDLPWQDRVAAEDRLHRLRTKQSNLKIAEMTEKLEQAKAVGADVSDIIIPKPHTVTDTAKEIHGDSFSFGRHYENTRVNLLLASHMDNPEVAKAPSAKEAFKALKKIEQRKQDEALAISVGKLFTANEHTLLNGNCLELMARPDMQGRFNVILTDPPYGMGADSFGDGGGKLSNSEHHYDDSYESWVKLMQAWVPLTWAVTKPEAHLYAFCDLDNFHELKKMLQAVGWDVFRTPFVVRKVGSGRVPRPEHGPRRQYELVLYAIKGNKRVNQILPDVIEAEADTNTGHGAQKPVSVFSNLLSRSAKPGDEILDCFAGSGPIIPAGHTIKCKVTAMEQEAQYFGLMLKRIQLLKELESPMKLPGQ